MNPITDPAFFLIAGIGLVILGGAMVWLIFVHLIIPRRFVRLPRNRRGQLHSPPF